MHLFHNVETITVNYNTVSGKCEHLLEASVENIFSLNYPEYATINCIGKILKGTGYSAFIPVSRQQKGVDFILQNHKQSKRTIRFQVKSSKVYLENKPKYFDGKNEQTLWFKNFIHSGQYEKDNSDYYLFFGVYSITRKNMTKKSKKLRDWKEIILCFDEKFLFDKIDKNERFLYFHFTLSEKGNVSDVLATRGFKKDMNVADFLIERNLREILGVLCE